MLWIRLPLVELEKEPSPTVQSVEREAQGRRSQRSGPFGHSSCDLREENRSSTVLPQVPDCGTEAFGGPLHPCLTRHAPGTDLARLNRMGNQLDSGFQLSFLNNSICANRRFQSVESELVTSQNLARRARFWESQMPIQRTEIRLSTSRMSRHSSQPCPTPKHPFPLLIGQWPKATSGAVAGPSRNWLRIIAFASLRDSQMSIHESFVTRTVGVAPSTFPPIKSELESRLPTLREPLPE
jgi:hypothetical protein